MTLWVIKPGKHGEREETFLEKSIIAIGWHEMPDLSNISTRDELKEVYKEIYPDASLARMRNHAGQIYAFLKKAKIGDLVVVTHKTEPVISVAKITGEYNYQKNLEPLCMHSRKVDWIKKNISRNQFKQDLLFSFGAFMTFCQVSRNNAEERVKSIIEKQIDVTIEDEDFEEIDEKVDLEIIAQDQIREVIERNFKGHNLTYLIAAILHAKGFTTEVAPRGADDGIDILASSGIIGFDEPRLCVQVKSQSSPIAINVYRDFKGALEPFKTKNGLLVCWGGFKDTVLKTARKDHFMIRLWNSNKIIQEIYKHYNDLDSEFKIEIPLKQIWLLVEED